MYTFSIRKTLIVICCAAFLACALVLPSAADDEKQVLVISVTKAFRHSSIPLGEEIISSLGTESEQWTVDFARTDEELAQKMTASALQQYDAIVFNNTSGDLPFPDKQVFLDWVKAGGGVLGIHAATDTFHNWPEYIDMIGGRFVHHGDQANVEFLIEDPHHPAVARMPLTFSFLEEIYEFSDFSRDNVRVLIALDKHPNTGEPGDFPISWVRDYGDGRVFYTALGHREDLMENDIFRNHILGGMRWALQLVDGDGTPLPPPPQISQTEIQDGFHALFNGEDLTGWHVRTEGRALWKVQNGMLIMGHGGSDLISDEKFEDFVLRFDYMVPRGGNSGVYLRGRYEVQVLGDYEQKRIANFTNGAIFGKIAPSRFASRPGGEWQYAEVRLIDKRVSVMLNGVMIIDDVELDGPTGAALDGNVDQPGPIMLQGDHGPVAYRNIRIKPL